MTELASRRDTTLDRGIRPLGRPELRDPQSAGERGCMSANRVQTSVPAEVTYLESVRDHHQEHQDETANELLDAHLATERSANKALLAALVELDSRLAAERGTGEAMTTAMGELERRLGAERETVARWEAWADEAERLLAQNERDQRAGGSWLRRLRGR